jgi:spermidine synthase
VARRVLKPDITWVILLCFLVSGMSGLIYQVIWVRELVLVFGATTFAASTVLTAFMGGLAIGSYVFGQLGGRLKAPLRLYGILEICIGVYGLAVPFIFSVLPSVYEPIWLRLHLSFLALTIIRFVLASIVLIVPTALMGATLPVLSGYYARGGSSISSRVGRLYALNTFGAVLGAASSGFILIPAFGMKATTRTAAVMNIMLGLVAMGVARVRSEGSSPEAELRNVDLAKAETAAAEPAKRREARKTSRLTRFRFRWPRNANPTAGSSGPAEVITRGTVIAVLLCFGSSGFVALSYEVIWSRVLALIIGSSVYAFSIMLVTFLVGLAIGSALFARVTDRVSRPVATFGAIELGVGISALIGAYLFNQLPYVFVELYRLLASSNLAVLLLARFVVSATVMILPTLMLGALFPLAVRIAHQHFVSEVARLGAGTSLDSTSRTVGNVYAANTLGSIAGAFASGFILVPWLGLLGSLRLSVALNFVVGGALFVISRFAASSDSTGSKAAAPSSPGGWRFVRAFAPTAGSAGSIASPRRSTRAADIKSNKERRRSIRSPLNAPRVGLAIAVLALIFVGLFKPPWDVAVMSSAVYRYAPSISKMDHREFFNYFAGNGQGETIFYSEGITSTVAVQRQGGGRVLKVNGKPDASTAGDLPTQVLIGSLPLLVRPQTQNVLVIGLGSGVTLGSVERFPLKTVTCVELEPAVIEASHFFDDLNNRPLEDPRLRLIANDGRNFVDTTDEQFDVIVSEPSNPWLTGVANLFTYEYFRKGADKLRDDGVFSQWLQIYEMPPEDVKALIATFRSAFPCVYLFRGAEGDLMLLGGKRQFQLDLPTITSHLADPKISSDLDRVQIRSSADIMSRFYMGPAELAQFSAGAPLNTDDNALIEFSAPRRVGISEETVGRNVKELLAFSGTPGPYLSGAATDIPEAEAGMWVVAAPLKIRPPDEFMLDAALGAVRREDYGRAEQFVAYSLDLKDTARAHSIQGEIRAARGDQEAGLESWNRALALDPDHVFTLIDVGKYYLMKQDASRAAPYLDRAARLSPESARVHHLRGLAYQAQGENLQAVTEYRKTLPDGKYAHRIPTFYLNFGTALVSLGFYEEAVQMLEQYAKLAPTDVEAHYQLGAGYEVLAERSSSDSLTSQAIDELRRAIEIRPTHQMAHYYLSKAYRRLGLEDDAEREFELYERFLAK